MLFMSMASARTPLSGHRRLCKLYLQRSDRTVDINEHSRSDRPVIGRGTCTQHTDLYCPVMSKAH